MRATGLRLLTGAARIGATAVRGWGRIARKRARQAEASAPPLTTQELLWWRRRFRLRILISSQLLSPRLRSGFHAL